MSISADPFHRSFDAGQDARRVVFRVQTQVSGTNGQIVRAETATILRAREETSIVASYDGAVARILVNGRLYGRQNTAAAGCSMAELCDSAVPLGWARLGATTLIMLYAFRWRSRWQALVIAFVARAGALMAPRLSK